MKYHRYHCYNKDGKKIGKRVELGQTLVDLPDHTPWIRGAGPMPAAQHQALAEAMRRKFCGVPKTEEQKHRMSLAKLGKPKTPEHIKAMCLAQQKRHHG